MQVPITCFFEFFHLSSKNFIREEPPLKTLWYSAALLLWCSGVLLGGTSTKSIVAARTDVPPRIDGKLTDEVWNKAIPVSGFTQFDPDEGALPTEQTSVRVLYDDNALYIGVMCYDSDAPDIVEQLTRRDRTVQADRISVMIDSYRDNSTAFLFSGSASGVQSDGVLSQDGRVYDVQWDAVWDFDAAILPDGWSAEFKIPYSALRFAPQDSEYVWGINFRRFIARKQETDEWVMVPRRETTQGTISSVSKMGNVSGIADIHPPLHMEILPYTVSKLTSLSQSEPFSTQNNFSGSAGLDMKYGFTNNFTLDLAVNPDFGQVEVDQAVLNLTHFETFYPEKRPFFLEGAQQFAFGTMFDNKSLQLFYSRRIGVKPTIPLPDSGYAYLDPPQVTTILGAAKVTGRTDNGLTLAALSALTSREDAQEQNIQGTALSPVVVEPRASYDVVRLKQEIGDQSTIGMMATGAFKDDNYPALNGGVDWNLRLDEGNYLLDGYLAGSSDLPENGIQKQVGSAGRIGFAKPQGEHVLFFSAYDYSSRNFSISNLGFYSQPLEHGGYTEIIYKVDRASDPALRYGVIAQSNYRWNWDGINTVKQLELEPQWQFRNFWTLSIDYLHDFPAYDDQNRIVYGVYRRPSGNQLVTTVQTDARNAAFVTLVGGYLSTTRGMGTVYTDVGVTLRPSTWMEFDPELLYYRSRNEETWVIPYLTENGQNLFGNRDVDEYSMSLRGTITFTRQFSFQFFTQVFLAKGHYENFKQLLDPTTLAPYDYQDSPIYANPDFNEKVLNANLVLRWEYLPGSTIYLVWTQARDATDTVFGTSFGTDFANAFRVPMDNVFLAKISYWWSL